MHLNPEQQKAVELTDGPIMILAGAGSGKTRTLVSRIMYLIEEKRVSPYQVLAVTFSNKAAREMRERVALNSGIDIGALQITTFHSFCARLLRQEYQYLGLSKNFTIYDDSESKTIVKAILNKHGISQKEIPPQSILYYISSIKNLGYYPGANEVEKLIGEKIDQDDPFYRYYLEYEQELHKSNAVDFGGLITGVIQLFMTYPQVLERYQKKYQYVLVDEYQDTNRAQFLLIKLLCELKENICVVGDEDQSIYSWRGADIRNILDFEKLFPNAELIKLEQNYRSSKNIIQAATAVIAKNEYRKGKNMWTDNESGESISIVEISDDRAESEFIASEIVSIKQQGVSAEQIAVFYRNNSQSRMLEDSLRKAQVPYRIVGGIRFYERKEIKDMLSYLRLIINPKDSLAFSRIINVPSRGVGATSLRKLEAEAIKLQCSLWEVVQKIVNSTEDFKHLKLSGKILSAFKEMVYLIEEAKALEQQNESPSLIYEKLLNESGYLEYLHAQKNYESLSRIENLEELLSAIKQHEMAQDAASLTNFLETITLNAERESEGDVAEVSLMTVHGSKGLEYEYVFVAGVEEGLFPSFQSLEGGHQALEEERRLFYVAMTRAMKKLYLTFARSRMLWGSLKFNGPSRFINEIPSKYYQWRYVNTSPSDQSDDDSNDFADTYYTDDEKSFYQKIVKRETFPKGSKVKHQLYGAGVVLQSEGTNSDEKVIIRFNDGAKKKFMVKFAPIEKIE